MVIKHGRYGKFIACSGYPECKTTKPVTLGIACPEAGCAGQLVARRSQAGARLLRLLGLSRLHVRGLAAPGGGGVPEVRRDVPDRAAGARSRRAPLRARGVRLRARGRVGRSHDGRCWQRFLRYLAVERHASPHTVRAYRTDLEDFQRFCAEAGCAEVEAVDAG